MNTTAKAAVSDNHVGEVTLNDNALQIVFNRHFVCVQKVWARQYFLAGLLAVAVAAEAAAGVLQLTVGTRSALHRLTHFSISQAIGRRSKRAIQASVESLMIASCNGVSRRPPIRGPRAPCNDTAAPPPFQKRFSHR